MGRFIALFGAAIAIGGAVAGPAQAAEPKVDSTWVTGVTIDSAQVNALIDPGGSSTSFQVEYISEAGYQANLGAGREGFFGAGRSSEKLVGSGSSDLKAAQALEGLAQETTYRYRVSLRSTMGSSLGTERALMTRGFGAPLVLLDGRGWEMVSPVDKNGGEIQGLGANAERGVLQAASQGGAVSYSSATSFGEGGQGAPSASQYVSRRSASGWSVENITAPLLSAGYGPEPSGVPYRLFSTDLARGLLLGAPYPPLPGTGAPAGYRNYYLREDAGGAFTPLLTYPDVSGLLLAPQQLELGFAGASADLEHVVLSSCAALTANATEVAAGGGGCDPARPNLYEWSGGSGLTLVNLPVGGAVGASPARLAAPDGAISTDGSRVYWTDGSDLFLRDGAAGTVQVDEAAGGGGTFQAATPDGSVAFFTREGKLFRYDVGTAATTELTPAGGVLGVLGASADGSYVYFRTASGLYLDHAGTNIPIAAEADAGDSPPSTGTARVSADGTHLAFVSTAELTGYDNTDANSLEPDSEVYLYDATTATLTCASCRPTGERPEGPSSIPGAVADGQGEGATQAYKPRALSADGRRLFFDSSDSLVSKDSNKLPDVYEWEAAGEGNCAKPGGCVQLISRGSGGEASFADASADGADVFFLTDGSLVPADPGSTDLYDAREDGGFPEPPAAIPCEEDACQPLPSPPDDPAPGTLVPSTGNPPLHFPKGGKKKHRHQHRKHRARRRGGRRR